MRSRLLCGLHRAACIPALLLAAAGMLHAQPACTISGPDSLHFDTVTWNRYLPESFPIRVTVTNNGQGRLDSLFAFPRSSARFTIIPPASLLLADSLRAGDTAHAEFTLEVNPRDESGMDTIVVAVSGKAGARSECLLVLWVEKEYRPSNVIVCPPDSSLHLVFVDSLDTYAPDPLILPLVVANTGDAPSKESQILYIATPGVAPAIGQAPVLPLGVLAPGARADRMFAISPVRRSNDTVVTLRFRAQGRGGLKDRIIDTLCSVPLSIPAARAPVFALACENTPGIAVVDGVYDPNPFDWDVVVRNAGNARARGVRVLLSLPPGILIDAGMPTEAEVGTLDAGESRNVRFRLRALPAADADTAMICARVIDAYNRTGSCCDTIIRPAVLAPELGADCLILPDTIAWDAASGAYLPASFTARVRIGNTGRAAADSISAEIIISDPAIVLASPPAQIQYPSARLAAGSSVECSWLLVPQADPRPRDVRMTFIIRSRNAVEVQAQCVVHIAARPAILLECSARMAPADTLHYDASTLAYLPLRIDARVRNAGEAAALQAEAVVLLPPGVGLASGDSAVRRHPAGALDPGDAWDVAWDLRPIIRRLGTLDTVYIEFRAEGGRTLCTDRIFIVGIPPLTVLDLPTNLVAKHGRELRVPIRIDNTTGKDIHRLELAVTWDEAQLGYVALDRENCLLASGSPSARAWNLQAASAPGRLAILAEHPDSQLTGEGDLLALRFLVRYGAGVDALHWTWADIRFDTVASAVNRGGVLARFRHGQAILSGDCLEPLRATDEFVLGKSTDPLQLRARPNPFNPSTQISFFLPGEAVVSLRVFDVLGREHACLLNHALLAAGKHEVQFDAAASPSGMFHCILDAGGRRSMLHLVLVK